ncbi:hypothetical protein T265_03778 [Opisthorchis viverrini]|uniref:Uncharacterized protein n=1 Tax=Opisthorchis viverrini TaxID=6198 RepID=A0A074ZV33_OPIVI|nr:hypothetical protein T265_03778 [Opisthorchis viverrini]KER29677.1 hypothetical protein T265_03778 [Opisthorchis viverrini]
MPHPEGVGISRMLPPHALCLRRAWDLPLIIRILYTKMVKQDSSNLKHWFRLLHFRFLEKRESGTYNQALEVKACSVCSEIGSYTVHLSVTSTQQRARETELCETDGLLASGLYDQTSANYGASRIQSAQDGSRNSNKNNNCSAVTLFRCLTAMLPEGSTRVGMLPGYPSLDRGSREAEVGFERQTFRSPHEWRNRSRAVDEFPATLKVVFKKAFSCNTLPVPSCHAIRRKQEGWDTARLSKPRQGKSTGGGLVRSTDPPSGTKAELNIKEWGPRDPHCAWLETLQDMAANRCQWRSCCQFLSRLPDIDSMTSVFNTDASLPYNHDLFESFIVKKIMKPNASSGDGHILQWGLLYATENSLSKCLVRNSLTPSHTSYGPETEIVEHMKMSQFRCSNRSSLTAIQQNSPYCSLTHESLETPQVSRISQSDPSLVDLICHTIMRNNTTSKIRKALHNFVCFSLERKWRVQ